MDSSSLDHLIKTHPWGLPLLILLGFVSVLAIGSRVSGWHGLARQYRAEGAKPRQLKNFVWGQVGWMQFRNCLAVGGDERGLYLVPNLIFRLFHPPLLIPWSEVQGRERKSVFFMKTDTFSVGDRSVRIRLLASEMEAFDSYLPPVN
ncbi:hypothetical protein ACN469_42300 [Corallococcus terminator]